MGLVERYYDILNEDLARVVESILGRVYSAKPVCFQLQSAGVRFNNLSSLRLKCGSYLCMNPKLKPNGSFYFMCSTQCLPYFDLYLRKKLTVLSRMVWFYDSSGG